MGYRFLFTTITLALISSLSVFTLSGCNGEYRSFGVEDTNTSIGENEDNEMPGYLSIDDLPAYCGSPTVEVNGNAPYFTEEDLKRSSFETYKQLDSLNRCGQAFALIGPETMPTEKRGPIGMVKPTGWKISKYEWVDGGYLYNRCHLIAHSLAGENDNPLNLITGTRSLNLNGMLPHEERVASYVHDTGNHVLYRVTPAFKGDNLVADGVLIEAESVEDVGEGVQFCVWCYNVEPGVVIDYANGDNRPGDPEKDVYTNDTVADTPAHATSEDKPTNEPQSNPEGKTYVLNLNTHKFHYPDCPSVEDIKDNNKSEFKGTRSEAIENGYEPCGVCKP